MNPEWEVLYLLTQRVVNKWKEMLTEGGKAKLERMPLTRKLQRAITSGSLPHYSVSLFMCSM